MSLFVCFLCVCMCLFVCICVFVHVSVCFACVVCVCLCVGMFVCLLQVGFGRSPTHSLYIYDFYVGCIKYYLLFIYFL